MFKKILFAIIILGFMNVSFALTEISLLNLTNKPVELQYSKPTFYHIYIYRGTRPTIKIIDKILINSKEYHSFLSENTVYLDNKLFKISFVDTDIECAWIYIFNFIKKPHGYAVNVIINDKNIGTICINKFSPVDYQYHANIEYYGTDNTEYTFKIYTTGWWKNSELFPTELSLKINVNF